MATRTIANGGGNYNATGTWVEGVVPTSADDVVATATSGQLTVNVASAARSIDLSLYTNTLTMNANLTLGTASVTNTLGGASTTYAGTIGIIICNAAMTLVQNNTNRIPYLQFGTGTKTLNTNLYTQKFLNSVSITSNGNTIYSNNDFGLLTSSGIPGVYIGGTTNFVLDGSGLISFAYAGSGTFTINTSGTYNTIGRGMVIGGDISATQTPTFNFLSAGTPTLFNTVIHKQVGYNDNPKINVLVPHNLFINNQSCNAGTSILNINTTSGITCNLFATYNNPRPYTTDATIVDVRITGNTLSAQTLNLSTTYRTTSSTTNPPSAGSLTYKGLTLRLDPSYTHYFNKMELSGGGIPDKPVIRSTSGSQVPIVLGDKETSQIIDYDFTDVDASGGEQIVAINGTLSNTTNITTTYPSGGGGGGGSFTFVN